TDFFDNREQWENMADKVLFTGKIDQYFDYEYGQLEYRSLWFEHETLQTENYQGNAVVNYNDANVPYTRIIEHKHFEFTKSDHTVITREYPQEWTPGREAYYPVNDEVNQKIYTQYEKLKAGSNTLFGGRLAEYKYYDMHQIIGSALSLVKKEFA
ncbi:MAG: UDP-galactopyranose mutase, partial [Chitinophagaceae bacterium]